MRTPFCLGKRGSCVWLFLKKEVCSFSDGFNQNQTRRGTSYDNYPLKHTSSQPSQLL